MIRPTNLYRAKTNFPLRLGSALKEDFTGAAPRTLTELVRLPGLGRRAAKLVLEPRG